MHQNGGKMKKRRLVSVLLCISLLFAGGCGQKTAEKQPAIQETAEQTAKETHKGERENKQETVRETTPAAEQEEAAAGTGAATALSIMIMRQNMIRTAMKPSSVLIYRRSWL